MRGILLLLFIFSSVVAYGNILTPRDITEAVSGEIIYVKVDSDESVEELKARERSKLTNIFYAMEYFPERSEYKVFVLSIKPKRVKPGSKPEPEVEYPFQMSGFTYKNTGAKQAEFLALEGEKYNLKEDKTYFAVALILLVLIIVITLLFVVIARKRKQKLLIEKREKEKQRILALFELNINKENLSKIYKAIPQVETYFGLPQKELKGLEIAINNVQFAPSLEEVDLSRVNEELKKIKRSLDGEVL